MNISKTKESIEDTVEPESNNQNELESFIQQFKILAERRINRYSKKITSYETQKNNLSNHGYWSLGYFEGRKSILEELLDELNQV